MEFSLEDILAKSNYYKISCVDYTEDIEKWCNDNKKTLYLKMKNMQCSYIWEYSPLRKVIVLLVQFIYPPKVEWSMQWRVVVGRWIAEQLWADKKFNKSNRNIIFYEKSIDPHEWLFVFDETS
jgi:hypothetical protein